jgi:3-hydroxybutyryl-CoA dehydratase
MANPIRIKTIDGLSEGDAFTFSRKFSKDETEIFGDITRDYNPVHYDPRWTQLKSFNGLISHGLLVGSMICEIGGQMGWLATGMNFSFIRPVYFDDTIRCTFTITKIAHNGRAEAEAVFENQRGKQVCTAHLAGRLPDHEERKLLKQMTDEGDPTNRLSHKEYA